MCMKNTYLHSNLRLIALAARLGTCKGSCPKKVRPSGNTTGCFYRHYAALVFRPRRSTFLDDCRYDWKLHATQTNPNFDSYLNVRLRTVALCAFRVFVCKSLFISVLRAPSEILPSSFSIAWSVRCAVRWSQPSAPPRTIRWR